VRIENGQRPARNRIAVFGQKFLPNDVIPSGDVHSAILFQYHYMRESLVGRNSQSGQKHQVVNRHPVFVAFGNLNRRIQFVYSRPLLAPIMLTVNDEFMLGREVFEICEEGIRLGHPGRANAT
jgi:hypothetical protein